MANFKKNKQPISPHLSIYKPTLTMILSILHRITGIILYFGTILLVWWFFSLSNGLEEFKKISYFTNTPIGITIIFFYTWAILHHMHSGIKYFLWDLGKGFKLKTIELISKITLISPIIFTIIIWIIRYMLI